MKYLFPVSLLLVGLTIGYITGVNTGTNDLSINVSKSDSITTKLIYDTIVTREIIEVPIEKEEVLVIDTLIVQDSLDSTVVILDTLMAFLKEKPTDTIIEEVIKINKDTRIGVFSSDIIYLDYSSDKDSLLKNSLDINSVDNKKLIIEFWESPINYRGYKLSKYKLIVYGLSEQFDYKIYKRGKIYYLNFQSIFYEMIETNQFLPYLLVQESEVIND